MTDPAKRPDDRINPAADPADNPFETFRPLTTEERERYERMMDIMLADPNTDPWDIARCQMALDGKG
jgi:hypothetical protein